MSVRELVRGYVQESLLRKSGISELHDDDSLIEKGVLDSLALLNLLSFIEEKTGVRIPDDEVMLENFETVAAIERTVDRLRSAGLKG